MVKFKNDIVVYENSQLDAAPINLADLAQTCGYKVNQVSSQLKISPRQLERQFLKTIGISPKYWMRLQRMIRARHLIRSGRALKAIALELGFTKYDKFARELRQFYQLSPLDMVDNERRNCYDAGAFSVLA